MILFFWGGGEGGWKNDFCAKIVFGKNISSLLPYILFSLRLFDVTNNFFAWFDRAPPSPPPQKQIVHPSPSPPPPHHHHHKVKWSLSKTNLELRPKFFEKAVKRVLSKIAIVIFSYTYILMFLNLYFHTRLYKRAHFNVNESIPR